METNQNHDKPWNHLEKPWKPTKNHENPWNHLEKPWKSTKNHENHETTLKNHGNQLTFEMGEGGGAGITEKRYWRGVTTDLLDV